jgi:hypothetical protein
VDGDEDWEWDEDADWGDEAFVTSSVSLHPVGSGFADAEPTRPELADLRRYGKRLVRRFVAKARADERPTFARIIEAHLETSTRGLPLVEERWPGYEHVNVQAALDVWLADDARSAETIGMTNYRHRGPFGLSDLLGPDHEMHHGPRPGTCRRSACRPALPARPPNVCAQPSSW